MNLQIPKDKLGHIEVGFVVSNFSISFYALYLLSAHQELYLSSTMVAGFTAALSIGIIKELHDWLTGKGTPEMLDIVATVIGGIMGSLILVVLTLFIQWCLI